MKSESKISHNEVYIKPHFVIEVAAIHLNVNFVRQLKDNSDETQAVNNLKYKVIKMEVACNKH